MELSLPAPLPAPLRHGRGATLNALSPRFGDPAPLPDPMLWDEEDLVPLKTEISFEQPRTVITRNRSPDIPFDRSINAYRGCEHGCIYCFARPTHAYLGLSPGLDFETRLTVKRDVARLLEKELARPGYACAPIALGTNTDPYQPIESRWRTTRAILAVLDRWNHPVTITTKSARILDDLERLASLASRKLVAVTLSVTTLDARLARLMEPRAATPARSLSAIGRLAAAGVPVAVAVSPVIPGLTDHETEAILTAAARAGATSAMSIPLRLPLEVAPLFEAWLQGNLPDRAGKVLSAIRAMRGGKLNRPGFGDRFRATGAQADLQRKRFARACTRLGLGNGMAPLDCTRFGPPRSMQLSLFDDAGVLE